MKHSKKDINEVKWQRGTSALGTELADAIIRTLLRDDSGENALDLACGDGLLTKEICKHFNRVVAVDAASHHIGVARKNVPQAEFHISLIEDFNPAGELFSRIYMISVLEHLDNPIETLAMVRKWLNKNGSILVYVPNAFSLNRRIGHKMGLLKDNYELTSRDKEVGHQRFYDIESLTSCVTQSGLVVVSSGGTLLKPFSNDQMKWFMHGWRELDSDPDWHPKLLAALCEVGSELPQYANGIWVKCINTGKGK